MERGTEVREEAERTVIDHVQKCNIPGIKIVCFHHVRVIGGSPSILREVDFCCFVYFQGRFYILILEVKCNAISKKSGGTRKKANAQLKTFTEMLQDELNVQTDKLQTHAVWPRMDPTELCSVCGKSHPSLYEKPKDCRQPGTQSRTNPDPPGATEGALWNLLALTPSSCLSKDGLVLDVSKALPDSCPG